MYISRQQLNLQAVVNYALEQVVNNGGDVNPLAFDGNEDYAGKRRHDGMTSEQCMEEIVSELNDLKQMVSGDKGGKLTTAMLLLIADYATTVDHGHITAAVAPSGIADVVNELLLSTGLDGMAANRIRLAVEDIMTTLVMDVGEYA